MRKATEAPWLSRRYYGDRTPFPRFIRRRVEKYLQPLKKYEDWPRHSPLVWWFWLKYALKYVADWGVQILCNYGESVWLVLLWMVVVVVASSSYYSLSRGILLIESSHELGNMPVEWQHALIYSLGAFTSTGFARFEPTDDRIRLVTGMQAIVGIFLAGLLGFVVGNRIRRS